jgi:hypothetical protein
MKKKIDYKNVYEHYEKIRDNVLDKLIKFNSDNKFIYMGELDNLTFKELESFHKDDFQYFECDGINHFLDYVKLLMKIKELESK